MQVSFISGHLNLSQKEFDDHYKGHIDHVIENGGHFVVGDANGTDLMAQQYLGAMGYKNVTVYHMFDKPRNNENKYPTIGNYTSDDQRDAAMTECSDQDIAWVRTPEETKKLLGKKYRAGRISGTEKNILRRLKKINQ